MTLDENSSIWNFRSWGRPFRLVSPSLDCSSPETTPAQIECGWGFSTVLTRSGDVYAWWPSGESFEDQYRQTMAEMDEDESTKAVVPDNGAVIPCHTWEMERDPVKLPVLPDLPDLPAIGLSEKGRKKETKLIKIAAFDTCLVGLTNKGHVLKIDGLTDEDSVQIWRYVSGDARVICDRFLSHDTQLPTYSEIDKVKEHAVFGPTTDDNGQEKPPQVPLSSNTMHITHVSHIASRVVLI
jgi:SCF-associated factor 1